jgi:hypothetical protein
MASSLDISVRELPISHELLLSRALPLIPGWTFVSTHNAVGDSCFDLHGLSGSVSVKFVAQCLIV